MKVSFLDISNLLRKINIMMDKVSKVEKTKRKICGKWLIKYVIIVCDKLSLTSIIEYRCLNWGKTV